jgi:hypothetical protein
VNGGDEAGDPAEDEDDVEDALDHYVPIVESDDSEGEDDWSGECSR